MSQVSSNHPRESAKTPTASPERPHKLSRPGWPEVFVGLLVMAVVGVGGAVLLGRIGLDPGVYGLILTAWTGVAGIIAFAAAAMMRIRSLGAFSVRRTSVRWLLIGVGAGVVAFVLKGLAGIAYVAITGDTSTPQAVYAEGGSSGIMSLILATAFLGLLTPLGEELLFRGVLANALLRYGTFVGVVGSALIFALAHGINVVFPAALVMGLFGAELLRRSGSIWPAVVVHIMFNLPTVPALVLAGMG